MRFSLRKFLVVGLSTLIAAGVAGLYTSNTTHAEDYMRPAENQATSSRRVYVRKPIKVERMTGSVFATMHSMYWKHLHRDQKIGVVPFYHMGHDGYVVHIPGKSGIYYAPTNSHRWFGRKLRARRHHKHVSRWHRGTPRILGRDSVWLSTPVKIKQSKGVRYWGSYMRTLTPLGGGYGFNPTPLYFNKHKHFKEDGADAGAAAAIHPRYKLIGHRKYVIKAGLKAIVKVHNHNKVSIWNYGQYYGTFHRMSHHKLHQFYKHPRF